MFTPAPPLPTWLTREFPFRRRMWTRGDGAQIHFVDEGEGPAVVLFHGNPTWSFLWRKVIARLSGAGLRVIAPDLLGLGLSSKPRSPSFHVLDKHIDAQVGLLDALQLERYTIAGQDWGGPVAAGVAWRRPERVRAAMFANTAVLSPKRPFRSKGFHKFSHAPILSDLVFRGLGFPLQVLHKTQGDPASIGPTERHAYQYPLGNMLDRAAPLGLARMVPNSERHPTTRTLDLIDRNWVQHFDGPVALVWGLRDPILGRALKRMAASFPQATVTETQAGHFLQEEVPDELAGAIRDLQ